MTDPRLAELTEALRQLHDSRNMIVYDEAQAAKDILALLPARTATTEAVALAARLVDALQRAMVSGCHMTSGGTDGVWCIDHDAPWAEPESLVCSDGVFIADTLAAALAATGGDWTEPQSLMPVDGGKA